MGARTGKLQVWVKGGTDLARRDLLSASDGYVIVSLDSVKLGKTKTIWNNSNPKWDEKMAVQVTKPRSELKFRVMDKDKFSFDDLIGEARLDLDDIHDEYLQDRMLPLFRNDEKAGLIHVSVRLTEA